MCGGFEGTPLDHVEHHRELVLTDVKYMKSDLAAIDAIDPAAGKKLRDEIAIALGFATPSDSLNVRESLAEIPPTGADQFVEGLEAGARAAASEPLAAVTGL